MGEGVPAGSPKNFAPGSVPPLPPIYHATGRTADFFGGAVLISVFKPLLECGPDSAPAHQIIHAQNVCRRLELFIICDGPVTTVAFSVNIGERGLD